MYFHSKEHDNPLYSICSGLKFFRFRGFKSEDHRVSRPFAWSLDKVSEVWLCQNTRCPSELIIPPNQLSSKVPLCKEASDQKAVRRLSVSDLGTTRPTVAASSVEPPLSANIPAFRHQKAIVDGIVPERHSGGNHHVDIDVGESPSVRFRPARWLDQHQQ
ncbi:uncharacterized protein LOC134223020 [Armigeres subalbatus]|uniref:uncharacterized protein LOC134223020 n=1 Tax=Armigeres subalbatus TaxID=124917 RepID=UPI002ED1E752